MRCKIAYAKIFKSFRMVAVYTNVNLFLYSVLYLDGVVDRPRASHD